MKKDREETSATIVPLKSPPVTVVYRKRRNPNTGVPRGDWSVAHIIRHSGSDPHEGDRASRSYDAGYIGQYKLEHPDHNFSNHIHHAVTYSHPDKIPKTQNELQQTVSDDHSASMERKRAGKVLMHSSGVMHSIDELKPAHIKPPHAPTNENSSVQESSMFEELDLARDKNPSTRFAVYYKHPERSAWEYHSSHDSLADAKSKQANLRAEGFKSYADPKPIHKSAFNAGELARNAHDHVTGHLIPSLARQAAANTSRAQSILSHVGSK